MITPNHRPCSAAQLGHPCTMPATTPEGQRPLCAKHAAHFAPFEVWQHDPYRKRYTRAGLHAFTEAQTRIAAHTGPVRICDSGRGDGLTLIFLDSPRKAAPKGGR